jgi:4-hydroxythreonine-4-phosphate dehydrogenase
MMLVAGALRVVLVTTHLPLREVTRVLTTERVVRAGRLTAQALTRWWGLQAPRLAVCGLNPHAGEHGLFGTEEADHIAPAIAAARRVGIDASGPHPADTVFFQAVHQQRHDAIVCMYHDQGHGPMKLLAFEDGVNVTLGLPIIRTSVDHGTAFDIAWTGRAFTGSLRHALAYAWKLAGRPG